MQELDGLRAVPFHHVSLALPPRTLVFKHVPGFHVFSRLTHQNMHVGIIQDCQGATVTLIRGVEIAGIVFWHSSG
eukprot:8099242-Pyramimonas_sp.AAC.2